MSVLLKSVGQNRVSFIFKSTAQWRGVRHVFGLIHEVMANCWQSTPQVNLFFRQRKSDPDPLSLPHLTETATAIAALFQRAQRRDPQSADALWSLQDELQPYAEIDDAYYRRVFHGVMGATANIRLGFRCNQNCGLCWQGRHWPDAPTELYFTWLHEIAAQGVRQVTFTGGEPLLHPALPDLLSLARDLGMSTMLQTNAMLLNRKALRRALKTAELGRLFVSFHAADPTISDRMTNAPKTHSLTVSGIKAALTDGFRVGLNAVVTQENHCVLKEHADFIVSCFVKPFPDNPVESVNYSRPQRFYDLDYWHAQIAPYDVIRPQLHEAVSILKTNGVILDVTAGSCGLPACLLDSHPDLIYLPREEDKGMADPVDPSIPDGHACKRCQLNDRCQGPGHLYIEKYGERGLRPFLDVPDIGFSFHSR